MVEYVGEHWSVDRDHILLTGLSDGATFSLLAGLAENSLFTALAPVSGVLHPLNFANGNLARARDRRIYLVHGALDWMFPVSLAREASETLTTAGLAVTEIEPTWRNKLLSVITDPSVAYMLLMLGIYGLIFEGYNPGAILPGVVGAISILLALYAFQILPVNYAGLGLIALGVILLIAEVFAPSFGALGIGGVIALVSGSIILMDTDVPGYQISRSLVLSVAILSSAMIVGIVYFAIRARSRPVVSFLPPAT